jgi:itaconate CoA-transferase
MLRLQNEREWLLFCENVLWDVRLASDERFINNTQRHHHRDELKQLIDQCFAKLSITEVEARLDQAKIAHARMNSMHEV